MRVRVQVDEEKLVLLLGAAQGLAIGALEEGGVARPPALLKLQAEETHGRARVPLLLRALRQERHCAG